MPFPTMPDPAADRAHEEARRHPERETLELATAGAAKVLGHGYFIRSPHRSGNPNLPQNLHT